MIFIVLDCGVGGAGCPGFWKIVEILMIFIVLACGVVGAGGPRTMVKAGNLSGHCEMNAEEILDECGVARRGGARFDTQGLCWCSCRGTICSVIYADWRHLPR